MIGCVKGHGVLGLSKQLRGRKEYMYILGFAVVIKITSNFENTIEDNNNFSLSDSLISFY